MNTDDEQIPTRRSLLSRIRNWNNAASWQDFHNTYWKLIYNTARRAGLSPMDAEEVAQETLITIAKSIRGFRYDREQGSFKGWLRTTTTWRIRDRLQRQRSRPTESLEESNHWQDLAEIPDPTNDPITRNWDLDWEKNLADTALERVKQRVSVKHFQIFDLAVIKQWPTEKIAKTFDVGVGQVYLIKHRVSAKLKSELKKLRRDPCQINGLVVS
jgi:RNA polymerase sigma-70 factor (ECF subfamily)